jgi:hypothetical protein
MNRPVIEEHRILSRLEWSLEAIEDGRQDEAYTVINDLFNELGSAAIGCTA